MNCPDCDRELTSSKCRCGYVQRSPISVDKKDQNTCKGHGCFKPWSINGFCSDCWQRVNKPPSPGSAEIAHNELAKIRAMMGNIFKKLPYDPRKRHA